MMRELIPYHLPIIAFTIFLEEILLVNDIIKWQCLMGGFYFGSIK